MINLEIRIGSRPYQITCREGQEPHYEALTKIINEKIATAESGARLDERDAAADVRDAAAGG